MRPPAERAAAVAAFLDAAAPGWAATSDPLAAPPEILFAALEPHARRVGLDLPTFMRAHGWIDDAAVAGPFVAAWHTELERRRRAPPCAFCGAPLYEWPPLGQPQRCGACVLLARRQGVRL